MKRDKLEELLLQTLEHERGGVEVYTKALECVQNEDLKQEWTEYLEQTRTHVDAVTGAIEAFGIDPERETPSRAVVRHVGKALVAAMQQALDAGDPAGAELVAAECVVLAETKDHLDWELLGECVEKLSGDEKTALQEAHEQVEDEEDEHLYHSTGWCRELWLQTLGLGAVLPPPEERKHVKTAIGAARAKNRRGEMKRSKKGGEKKGQRKAGAS